MVAFVFIFFTIPESSFVKGFVLFFLFSLILHDHIISLLPSFL